MAVYSQVGTFAKTTAAATASQTVRGVGFTPKAVLLWTSVRTANDIGGGHNGIAVGMTSGASESRSCAIGLEDAQAATITSARRWCAKALTIIDYATTLLAECDLTSFDADGFTLSWTTNDANAYLVNYLAIGGDEISAKVVEWVMPTTAIAAPVTGVGFTPSAVIHLCSANGATAAPPTTSTTGAISLGVMTAAAQWVWMVRSTISVMTSNTDRIQLTNACLASITNAGAIQYQAAYTSMDADGFTTTFSAATGANYCFSLALKGGRFAAGTFAKSTSAAPVTQSITGIGFRPIAALLTSDQNTTSGAGAANARLGIGAAATEEAAATLADENGAATSNVDSSQSASKCFQVVDNATATVDAEADFAGQTADGFDLRWTTNHATATELLYLAVGRSFDAAYPSETGEVDLYRGAE